MNKILVSEILAKFEKFEKDFNLGSSRIHEIPWWDLVRYPLYRDILVANKLHENRQKTDVKSVVIRYLTLFSKIFSILGKKSPIWIKRNQILIFGHPRRKIENGLYIDIYSDPFIQLLPDSIKYSVIEKPGPGRLGPSYSDNLYYLDLFLYIKRIFSLFTIVSFNSSTKEDLKRINDKLFQLFGYSTNISHRIKSYIKSWKSLYPLMRLFFRMKKPTHVFIVVSAGYEIVIAAAKAEGIQTIELQHGSPVRGKLNYDYSSGIAKSTFPDWFVAFGEYWIQDIKLPIPDTQIFYLGFPYFSLKTASYKNFVKENLIVIVSQKTISQVLVNFSIQLLQYLEPGVNIIYKPHPAEYCNGLLPYERELVNAGILVAKSTDDLYSLFAKARWQVGVYSTALYEGVAFGVACFVVRTAGSEHMERLVKIGLAKFVHSPIEVDLSYQIDCRQRSLLFKPVEKKSIRQLLELTSQNT